MNTLTIAVFACLAVMATARPWDDGQWHGDGIWDDGHWDGDYWGGWHDGHVVHGNGATIIAPGGGHAVITGPVDHGHGWGHWGGHGLGAHIVGPAGSIVTDGVYAGHYGHHW